MRSDPLPSSHRATPEHRPKPRSLGGPGDTGIPDITAILPHEISLIFNPYAFSTHGGETIPGIPVSPVDGIFFTRQ